MLSQKFVRWTGIASIIGGLLAAVGFAIHPATEDVPSILGGLWVPAHLLLWFGFILVLFGPIGIYAKLAGKAGMLGLLGYLLTSAGIAMVLGILFVAFTVEPIIAAEAPQVLEAVKNSPVLLVFLLTIVVANIGSILLGAAVARTRVLPRGGGIVLILGSIIVLVSILAMLPEKVSDFGGVLIGASLIWLGYAVWSGKD